MSNYYVEKRYDDQSAEILEGINKKIMVDDSTEKSD